MHNCGILLMRSIRFLLSSSVLCVWMGTSIQTKWHESCPLVFEMLPTALTSQLNACAVLQGSPWRHLIAGALAGAASRTATAPLETLRLQVETGFGSALDDPFVRRKMNGCVHCASPSRLPTSSAIGASVEGAASSCDPPMLPSRSGLQPTSSLRTAGFRFLNPKP